MGLACIILSCLPICLPRQSRAKYCPHRASSYKAVTGKATRESACAASKLTRSNVQSYKRKDTYVRCAYACVCVASIQHLVSARRKSIPRTEKEREGEKKREQRHIYRFVESCKSNVNGDLVSGIKSLKQRRITIKIKVREHKGCHGPRSSSVVHGLL